MDEKAPDVYRTPMYEGRHGRGEDRSQHSAQAKNNTLNTTPTIAPPETAILSFAPLVVVEAAAPALPVPVLLVLIRLAPLVVATPVGAGNPV